MPIKTIILTFFLISMVGIVWFFQPGIDTNQDKTNVKTSLVSIPQAAASMSSKAPSNSSIGYELNLEPSKTQTEESFDTKSDFSIQPIDPETDTGNQILDTRP